MAPGQSALVSKMIDLTLMPYPAADVAYAWQCIEANGGLDAMHVSFYANSRYNNEGGYQTYRLEGPASVFYFRGFPHVHAFFNVAMDADAPLSVGRVVGRNPKHIEGERLTELFEQAMQQHNGVDFAWYPGESAVGVLREGTVRTGDVYTAESWENRVTVLELTGGEFSTQMADTLQARGAVIDPARRYRIATVDYVVSAMLESAIGQATVVGDGGLLRDQTIAHIEAHGFA